MELVLWLTTDDGRNLVFAGLAACTVAGVPAILVGESQEENPAIEMNQNLDCRDS